MGLFNESPKDRKARMEAQTAPEKRVLKALYRAGAIDAEQLYDAEQAVGDLFDEHEKEMEEALKKHLPAWYQMLGGDPSA